ncbi:MAG: dihydroorotate dehydrogenase [Selenomonadales bacterium]|jgi:dihydroorotate dehydrogenase (NAD+) catalytic subunit|nr:dihydroorotate dehydrogenase [Selenomonadales bacterium]
MSERLKVALCGLALSSPVLSASGCYGYGREFDSFYDLRLLGAVVVKGITLKPRYGNSGRRLSETPAGLINSIGLENPGVEGFIAEELPFLRDMGVPVIVNISGNTAEEYAELAARLNGVPGVSMLEVNISCPNVKQGGMAFGATCETAAGVTRLVRRQTSLPLTVKLSPNVTDIASIAQSVEAEGADCISLINTLLSMAIDVEARRPVLNNIFGGLSGPAIKPIALRMVWQVAGAVKVPIIGMGGISTWQDAAEFILAGATCVAVGTANFFNPAVIPEITTGLAEYASKQGVANIQDLVGAARNK